MPGFIWSGWIDVSTSRAEREIPIAALGIHNHFKNKQKVPHSYSRALPIHAKSGREREPENARFANGVRDDETKKDYINPEIALEIDLCIFAVIAIPRCARDFTFVTISLL